MSSSNVLQLSSFETESLRLSASQLNRLASSKRRESACLRPSPCTFSWITDAYRVPSFLREYWGPEVPLVSQLYGLSNSPVLLLLYVFVNNPGTQGQGHLSSQCPHSILTSVTNVLFLPLEVSTAFS